MNLKILKSDLLSQYLNEVPEGLLKAFSSLKDAEISTPEFSFYTSVASVFSSKIEGEEIELDSYIKHKRNGISFQPHYTKKTDDLYAAYVYAQKNPLTEENLKHAHKILSRHIVAENWQGKYRNQNMFVTTDDGKIEYVAALPAVVPQEMKNFFYDVQQLLKTEISIQEIFFYASLIHLVFAKIHPWNDGNGRSARLLEKWFLAEKLGQNAWFIQSEKFYYLNHQLYYTNLRALGLEYQLLDYSKSLPFLLMLPNSLKSNG